MTEDARAEILARIRAALNLSSSVAVAPQERTAVVRSSAFDDTIADELCSRFARELAAVGGEAIIVREDGIDALAFVVAERVALLGHHAVAAQRDPFAQSAASQIPAVDLVDLTGASADALEKADCAIIGAEWLIANTGSAVVHLTTYEDRMLPYLPPACIIVGRVSQLTSSLNGDALRADDGERGERVIVTGPSRTADIEKTVVLGAHGPGSLTVIIARC